MTLRPIVFDSGRRLLAALLLLAPGFSAMCLRCSYDFPNAPSPTRHRRRQRPETMDGEYRRVEVMQSFLRRQACSAAG